MEELDHVLGVAHYGVVRLGRAQGRAIGITPLLDPLAVVIRSGATPKRCAAKARPRHPKPVMTSPKISRMLCLRVLERSFFHVHDTGLAPTLTVRAGGEVAIRHDNTVFLTPEPDKIHRFDQNGLWI